MQPRIRFVNAALLAGLMLLAGCGQKGPLYLPEKEDSPEAEVVSKNQESPAENQAAPGAD